MKGILGIHAFVFGIATVVMFVFAFLPPIVLTGLIFLTLAIGYVLTPKIESAIEI
jgi:hypothetical protein